MKELNCPFCGKGAVLATVLITIYYTQEHTIYEDGIKMDGDSLGEMFGTPGEPSMKYTSFRCTSCKKKWIQSQCKLIHDENGVHRFEIQEK